MFEAIQTRNGKYTLIFDTNTESFMFLGKDELKDYDLVYDKFESIIKICGDCYIKQFDIGLLEATGHINPTICIGENVYKLSNDLFFYRNHCIEYTGMYDVYLTKAKDELGIDSGFRYSRRKSFDICIDIQVRMPLSNNRKLWIYTGRKRLVNRRVKLRLDRYSINGMLNGNENMGIFCSTLFDSYCESALTLDEIKLRYLDIKNCSIDFNSDEFLDILPVKTKKLLAFG